MRKIIWLIGLILFLTGLIYSNDKPVTKIVPYTSTSIGDFLKDPFAMYNQTDWIAHPPGIGDWTTYTFVLGDTVTTFGVTNARIVEFVFADSSLAGVDTIGIKQKVTGPTTDFLFPSIFVIPYNDTSTVSNTGKIPADSLICTNGVTRGFAWLPLGNSTYTGTFQIYRKNANGYAPKTRAAWRYE